MSEIKKSYYAIIPANVRYDQDLTDGAKLLYGEVTALCNEKGYCWASNQYFAKLYGVSERTISRWINQLVENNHIYSNLKYKKDGNKVETRYLTLDKNVQGRQKCLEGVDKNVQDEVDKNVQENTTSINTTSNKRKKAKNTYDVIINEFTENEELKETLYEFLKMRKLNKKVMTDKALQLLIDKLVKHGKTVEEQIEMLNRSIEGCWLSVYPLKDGQKQKNSGRDDNPYAHLPHYGGS